MSEGEKGCLFYIWLLFQKQDSAYGLQTPVKSSSTLAVKCAVTSCCTEQIVFYIDVPIWKPVHGTICIIAIVFKTNSSGLNQTKQKPPSSCL